MKLVTSTLFLTLAVVLHSIEVNSQTWIGKSREKRISPEPTVGLYFHAYEDASTNQIHRVTPGSKVTLGIRKLGGTDHIVGIVKDRIMHPILDNRGKKFLVNMRFERKVVPSATQDIPYGKKPHHTIDAIVNHPPPLDYHG